MAAPFWGALQGQRDQRSLESSTIAAKHLGRRFAGHDREGSHDLMLLKMHPLSEQILVAAQPLDKDRIYRQMTCFFGVSNQ